MVQSVKRFIIALRTERWEGLPILALCTPSHLRSKCLDILSQIGDSLYTWFPGFVRLDPCLAVLEELE